MQNISPAGKSQKTATYTAAAPGVELPYIRLDLYVKEPFFVLFCEIAAAITHTKTPLEAHSVRGGRKAATGN